MTATEWIILIFAGLATLFSLFASLGLLRLPDVYSRLHSAGKSATGGAIFSVFAVIIYMIYQQDTFILELFLVVFFVLITSPIVTLALARSAYYTGVSLEKNYLYDDLAKATRKKEEKTK